MQGFRPREGPNGTRRRGKHRAQRKGLPIRGSEWTGNLWGFGCSCPGPTSKTKKCPLSEAQAGQASATSPNPRPCSRPQRTADTVSLPRNRPETSPEPGETPQPEGTAQGWFEPSPSPPREPGPADATPLGVVQGRAVGTRPGPETPRLKTATGPPRDKHRQEVFRLSLRFNRAILYLFTLTIKYRGFCFMSLFLS